MRVTLCYPPDFNRPTMVFGALPLFNACLKSAGHTTSLIDINAEAFTGMLMPENLERYLGVLDTITNELAASSNRSPEEEERYRTYRRLHVFPRDLMRSARACAEGLRDPDRFYDPAEYVRMDRVIRTTHAFLHSFTPTLDPRNERYVDQLYDYLSSDALDPYTEYYRASLIPRLAAFDPQLIAMSCPFSPQVATGMYFAKLVREALPNVKFVMGGTGLSDHTDLILRDPRFYDFVDFGIVGDGEESLCELAEAMEGRREFGAVAGLFRRDDEGRVVPPGRYKNVDLDTTPAPDYAEVDFSHYMLPEPAIIYTTSRGCYYGKCTFCPESFRVGFRKRSPERVYADVAALVDQGVRNIHFFDPLTPPVTLERVSRLIAKNDLPVNWYAEVKFENIYTNPDYVRKLAEGGCRQLQFGYESGVQRVLDGMKKGNRLDMMEVILDHLRAHGITVAVTWFIGFPTESEEEARESWRYLRRHYDRIHLSLYTGTFGLGHDVPVYQHPEEYGIEILVDAAGNPTYRRLDGGDWDQQTLHEAFHARGDLPIAISGAGLLYAANNPEGLFEIHGMTNVGPTSLDDPAIPERVVRIPAENRCVAVDAGGPYLVFVAASGSIFEVDAVDAELLERIAGLSGRPLADLAHDPGAPEDLSERLRRFVDRGYVESGDPLLEARRGGMRVEARS